MCLLAFLEAVCCQGAAYPHNGSDPRAYNGSLELLYGAASHDLSTHECLLFEHRSILNHKFQITGTH